MIVPVVPLVELIWAGWLFWLKIFAVAIVPPAPTFAVLGSFWVGLPWLSKLVVAVWLIVVLAVVWLFVNRFAAVPVDMFPVLWVVCWGLVAGLLVKMLPAVFWELDVVFGLLEEALPAVVGTLLSG
jgi:hypothetical protein